MSWIISSIVPVLIILLVLALIVTNIRIVPQAHCVIIERLGKFRTVWEAGLHIKVPLIDRAVGMVSLKEQVLDFPPQAVITKDNVTMQIDSVVYARVFEPKLYKYGVENPVVGLQNLAATTLRNVIGEMELDQTLTSRDAINAKMQTILDEATDAWGIKVTRVEIKNMTPPREIEEVMTKQMRAERERRQTVLEAQAHQEAVVSRAEGDKRAKVLAAEAEREAQIALAEGRAKSIRLVYEAEAEGIHRIANSGINEEVLRLKSIEAMKDVADGQATKIFIPNDLSKSLSALGTIGEALGIGQSFAPQGAAKTPPAPEEDPCIDEETSRAGRQAAETTGRLARQAERRSDIRRQVNTDGTPIE